MIRKSDSDRMYKQSVFSIPSYGFDQNARPPSALCRCLYIRAWRRPCQVLSGPAILLKITFKLFINGNIFEGDLLISL